MTLELSKVTGQIEEMGRVLAERNRRQGHILPAARELLRLFAREHELLTGISNSEPGQRLRCASPGPEPLDAAWPAVPCPECATLIAADGSQIYPDRHGLAFYYVINVGAIVFRHGSGQAPHVATVPRLFFSDQEVYPNGEPVSGDLVNAERTLAEMRTLADLAVAEPEKGPLRLALADGPLLIWLQRSDLARDRQAQILAGYLAALDRLQAGRVPVAGFVSRPVSAEVVALLYLAHLPADERATVVSLGQTGYRGLTDRALFGFLSEGQRSALFIRGTAANQDFGVRGHRVYFFYLNTGSDLARVEVPQWVALHRASLDLVHAAVYEQCRLNNGYPYVLTRADEQAVILGQEREALENMIAQAIARCGLPPLELSRKAAQKQVARWRRSR